MAQEQQQQELTPLVAMHPAPPPFYKNFTKQNVNELRTLRKEAGVSTISQSNRQTNGGQAQKHDIDILSLPPELRYLIPPRPPADGTYTTFGQSQSLNPSDPTLASRDIAQLYPTHPSILSNPQPHLIALARSLLTKYLHILGVLAHDPTAYEQSTQELEAIVTNMHDLINRYRPHQARESLILMMEERVERLRGECRGIDEGARKAGELLRGFEGDTKGRVGVEGEVGQRVEGDDGGGEEDEEVRRRVRQEGAWAALQQELGEG